MKGLLKEQEMPFYKRWIKYSKFSTPKHLMLVGCLFLMLVSTLILLSSVRLRNNLPIEEEENVDDSAKLRSIDTSRNEVKAPPSMELFKTAPQPLLTSQGLQAKFKFDLTNRKPDYAVSGGNIRTAHIGTFPVLSGMGTYLVTLKPGGLRIPHWHPVCNELNYVISGTAKIGLGSPSVAADHKQEGHEEFILQQGQIAFIPRGWLHFIKNVGSDELNVLVVFDSEKPDDIGLSQGLAAIPNSVLGETFGVNASTFQSFHKSAPLIMPDES